MLILYTLHEKIATKIFVNYSVGLLKQIIDGYENITEKQRKGENLSAYQEDILKKFEKIYFGQSYIKPPLGNTK